MGDSYFGRLLFSMLLLPCKSDSIDDRGIGLELFVIDDDGVGGGELNLGARIVEESQEEDEGKQSILRMFMITCVVVFGTLTVG